MVSDCDRLLKMVRDSVSSCRVFKVDLWLVLYNGGVNRKRLPINLGLGMDSYEIKQCIEILLFIRTSR